MKTAFDRVSAMTADQRTALTDRFETASRIAAAEPVAVVGIGCRFPGGGIGPQGYWDFLANGGDAIGEVPADRWDADAFYDPDPTVPGRMASKWGAFLPDIAGFDADFFGISPREAEAMDPQQRVLLEVAWEALEHAGVAPEDINGLRAAVMVGLYYTEYQAVSGANPDTIDAYSATGNAHSVAVGRIAYLLGLHGAAVAVDSACSSSLVSVHLACQSLRLRESDIALAGGVSLILRPETQLALSKWGMLSPRGRCHSFDAGADGFVRGEGAGMVVLKRLTDAVRDGDRVLAVVRGSAVNQDGRSNGLTAPNALAQEDVMTRALRASDVSAGSVSLVETHGTGTSLGDPIEFDALAAIYGQGARPCALGAVKTNFGHLEAAAGIAGFIKSVLSIERAQIPPNLHFTQWNPAIDASSTRLFIPTRTTDWPDPSEPRRAAVSSFGLGGTNAHIVLEQGPDPQPVTAPQPSVTTLMVSGKTPERLASTAEMLADWIERTGAAVPLTEVAHTLNHHRARHSSSASVTAADGVQAVEGLRALAAGRPAPGLVRLPEHPPGQGVVFVYSGQGSQWAGMGRRLLVDEPAFAAAVDDLEPDFVAQAGFSLRQTLELGEPIVGIDRIQPVVVAIQLALTELWRSYGVTPDAVIGHSMGEVSAAVVAGALSPTEGLTVIATRSRLMARLSGQGAMALLELDAQATEKLIADYGDVTLAVYASPRQTVIAGPPSQVDAVIAAVEAQNRLARRVEVDVASHHPTVDPILPELRTALAGLAPTTPKIPVLSTTRREGADAPAFDADYWVDNLRHSVQFAQSVADAADRHATFVEVSPHPLLAHALIDNLEAARPRGDVLVTGTLHREDNETLTFHSQLSTVRRPSDEDEPCGNGRLADIPPTPWQHRRYWLASRPLDRALTGTHPLLGLHVELPSGRDHMWQADVGTDVLGWLADHQVHGRAVMPAAGFAEMALAGASDALGIPAHRVTVKRLEVEQMLALDAQTMVTTYLTRGADADVRVEINCRSAHGNWTRHAVAQISTEQTALLPPSSLRAENSCEVSVADMYAALRRTGAHHGQAFAALTRVWRAVGDSSAESEIVLPDEATAHRGYRIHPVMLDAALQTLAAAMPEEASADSAEVTYLPVSFETLRVFGDTGRRARCHAALVNLDDEGAGKLGRIVLMDPAGQPTAEITGVYLRRVERRTVPLPLEQKIFDIRWQESAPPETGGESSAAAAGSWLMLSDGSETKAFADRFAAAFAGPSRRVVTEHLFDESAVIEAFAKTASDPDVPPVGVVVFVGTRSFDATTSDDALERTRATISSISATLRATVGGWHGTSPRLWLVTRRGLVAGDDGPGDPAIGALTGLVRVVAYEHPDLHATLIDLDAADDDIAALQAEFESPGRDDVIAWRNGRRYLQRLARATLGESQGAQTVRADGSYILTGGLGGLGLVVAHWLVDRGAGRVVLNGRSDPTDDQAVQLAELGSRAEIAFVAGDIATPGTADRLVAAAEATGLPLRGVMHAAAILDDGLVTTLSNESLQRVWAPKAGGALRLHEATAGRDLDWWIVFSSVASLLGSPGQAAYASANAWVDALVAWRRASGLPGLTINWGQWADVGLARSLTFGALDPISPAEGLEAMDAVVGDRLGRVGVARLRLDRAAAAFPEIRDLGYFTDMIDELAALDAGTDWPGPSALRDLDPADVGRVVTERLRERISAIMGYPDQSAIGELKPLLGLGMDSLMAVRIRNAARADFGVEPSVALLLQGASVHDLSADLVSQLGLAGSTAAQRPNDLRDRAHKRASSRQRAAVRRKEGRRV
ncbi:MAG: phthiocerol/phenolphthiocerol synthesis type-I polyketide synthase [Mycobacterium sp.]|nr:phthiocerol/phenolphthiocerol synthesis type-I polyketide synthase [Mycobacterium sp.]